MTFDFLPTICANFQRTVTEHADRIALRDALDGSTLTWRQYGERVRRIAAGLAGLGVGRGDTVGLMLLNRPEFHLVDAAAVHLGAAPFSVYNTNPAEAIAYQFGNAGNKVVVCEEQFLPRIRAAMADSDQIQHVICVDGHPEGTISLAELESRPAEDFDFEAAWRAVEPDDLLTIIYTSGTTGPPKGVELTHANLVANIRGAREVIDPNDRHRVVSYLPDAHIVNRYVCHYAPMIGGSETITLADPKRIVATLADVRPTGFVGVPQIWYKVKLAIESGLAAEPIAMKRQLGEWAISVGRQKVRLESAGRPIPTALRIQHAAAERLVLSRIRATMGLDQLIVAATGAAPIAADALEFVLGLGLPVCEAWGMSELAAVGTVNRPGRIRIGTVGQAATGVELRIADDGEVLVRGPIVMKGYRNEPDKTAEVIDADGWLHTGDIGVLDADGYLSIVDRKKELIINAGGKNMSPSNIEGQIRVACPLVGSAIAIGDDRPYVTALLTLDPDAAATFAKDHNLPDNSPAALATNPELRATIEAGIKLANDKLSRVEQIKKFRILPDTWEPGGDELTPTMKLRRKPIIAKYTTEIDALYAG